MKHHGRSRSFWGDSWSCVEEASSNSCLFFFSGEVGGVQDGMFILIGCLK